MADPVMVDPDLVTGEPKTTTDASVLRTAGQRRINLLWEGTQATIAILVVASVLYVTVRVMLKALEPDAKESVLAMAASALVLLSSIVNVVVTCYFMRTNHVRTGGVGAEDKGR